MTRLGVPDRRLPTLLPQLIAVVERDADGLEPVERRSLDLLVDDLPERIRAIAACGVPDTLVHGDFHPGNVVGVPSDARDPGGQVILDWGDSFVGHPMLDELAFSRSLTPAGRGAVREWFVAEWATNVQGSDPARAAALLEPVASLVAALMYANFCRAIEPDERVYHRADVVRMLRAAASAGRRRAG